MPSTQCSTQGSTACLTPDLSQAPMQIVNYPATKGPTLDERVGSDSLGSWKGLTLTSGPRSRS